jgi:hypothetical protein
MQGLSLGLPHQCCWCGRWTVDLGREDGLVGWGLPGRGQHWGRPWAHCRTNQWDKRDWTRSC